MILAEKHCVPCEGKVAPLVEDEENALLKEIPEWQINRELIHKLTREFKFKNFKKAIGFVLEVARIAETEGHHPDIHIYYSRVTIELYTHAILGLSENDFIMASKIDAISAD